MYSVFTLKTSLVYNQASMDTSIFRRTFPKLREEEPLARHSTFRVGGPARLFYEVTEIDEIPPLIGLAGKLEFPYLLFGGGSNALFPDEGFNGLVIKIAARGVKINGPRIEAEAGAVVATIGSFGALRSIPGTVGGAIRGNAGALGIEIADIIESVSVFDPLSGQIRLLPREKLGMSYRDSVFKHTREIILKGFFNLAPLSEDKRERLSAEAFTEAMKFRREKQPAALSAGSFFKNPVPYVREKSAGYLIDQAGLKGKRVGDAQISDAHGNFFVNLGKATSRDMLELAELAKRTVREKFGVELEAEVQIFNQGHYLT